MIATQAENLMSEIRELHRQYVVEVGTGRRVWPKAIKDRVQQLDEIGISAKSISKQTGVGYDTILQWRFKRKKKNQFHQLSVSATTSKEIAKVDTVTVTKDEITSPDKILKSGTLTVTTPSGYRIESSCVESVVRLLETLKGPLCF